MRRSVDVDRGLSARGAIAAVIISGFGAFSLPARADNAACIAASEQSLTLKKRGALHGALEQLAVCADSACPSMVTAECLRRAEVVRAAMPTLILGAKDGSGVDLSAVKVTLDGAVLAERLGGTAVAVDPGLHVFVFEAAGQMPVTRTLVIREAEKNRRELVTFGPLLTAASVPATEPPAAASSTGASEGLGTSRVLGLVAGAVGLAGLGVGTGFGALAMSTRNDARAVCPNECATTGGRNKWNDAVLYGNVSTASFIVAGAGVVGAAVLWFAAPSRGKGPTTQVGVGAGTVQVNGVW